MLTPSQQSFLTLAATVSVQSEDITRVPAELSLPQAVFESGWGKSAPRCNCFGIKAHAGVVTQLLPTTEYFTPTQAKTFVALGGGRTAVLVPNHTAHGLDLYDCLDLFAAYTTFTECFNDHGRLIASGAPYAPAWSRYNASHDLSQFILDIGKVYATTPGYGSTLLSFSQSSTIVNALKTARASDTLNA